MQDDNDGHPSATMEEWLTPQQVLDRYARSNGGYSTLKDDVAFLLRHEKLHARVSELHEVEAPSMAAARRMSQQGSADAVRKTESDPVPLDPHFWRNSTRWPEDRDEWLWDTGDFWITFEDDKHRLGFIGIEFFKADLDRELKEPAASHQAGKRTMEQLKWRHFAWALARVI